MNVCLCTVPTERPQDILDPSVRSRGEFPILPKIAITALVDVMEKNGFNQWDFYDIDMLLPTDQEIKDYFLKNPSDIVGLSAVVSSSFPQVERISKIIREVLPNSWIVVGGNLSAIADILLRNSEIDVCFVGEGEISWIDFLSYVDKNKKAFICEELEKIQGISFIDENDKFYFTGYGRKIKADDLLLPDYEILKVGLKEKPELINNYFRLAKNSSWFSFDDRVKMNVERPYLAHVSTSKGCTAKCTFCQRSINGYRIINLDKLEAHLIMLKEKYKVGFLSVFDENFGSDVDYTHKVSELFKKHDMIWVAGGVRCTNVTYDDIKLYKENNCIGLKFGVESGSQDILDIMEKKFSLEQVSEAINNCISLNIFSPLAVMVGMPGETNKTALETAKLIGTVAHKLGLPPTKMGWDMFYAMAFPGSSLYVYGQEIGVIGTTPEEEIKYLSNIAQPYGPKFNHANFSGEKIKDIVFWDYMIQIESRKVYNELVKKYGENPLSPVYRDISIGTYGEPEQANPGTGKKLSKFDKIIFYFKEGSLLKRLLKILYNKHTYFDKLLKSELVVKLPRGLVYPILRNLVYFKYITFKQMGAVDDILSENDKQIDKNLLSPEIRRKERSLRSIISQDFDITKEEGKIALLRRGA